MHRRQVVSCVVLVFVIGMTAAQDFPIPEPQTVQIEAADGLVLVGDYYKLQPLADQSRPAVILLHMIGSKRQSWSRLIPALLEAGYEVLTVDLRGHGDTGGEINWFAAVTDVQTWLDWLREQPGIEADAISIVGASIGANLALIGCANDDDCVTAIALSPGLVYYSLKTESSITNQLSKRSALLIASQTDQYSADSVKQLVNSATGDIGARIYAGTAHGTQLFEVSDAVREGLITLIVSWLDEHTVTEN